MKRIMIVLMTILVIALSGCVSNEPTGHNYIVLPDLSGLNESEIREVFANLDHQVTFEYFEEEDELLSNIFIEYKDHITGDIVDETNETIIIVYPVFTGDPSFIVLPNLEGLLKEEIINLFEDLGVIITFVNNGIATEDTADLFIEYGQYLVPGDTFDIDSVLPIIVYPELDNESHYFAPLDMEYDGPFLSEDFRDIDPLDPRGGYFAVTLNYCGDGDTAVFNYPQEVYDAIDSYAKSVRFLNMDTEETYSGGEEEWGKPASVYTCSLLTSAEEIMLQTDPGDNLLGTYGRLLAWVWIKLPGEDEFHLLNYMVVKQGLAQVKYEFGAGETISYGDYTYNEWMHIAEDYAILNDLGQWGDLLDYYWNYEEDKPDWTRWY
ncbi:MAG: thermonuclease family protein [Candidatus Izimaplasma sp.]|nr:thermonuclease family protein [Candidatus Izimaplasma bacterium]